jgi:hypothetical protein
MRPLLPFLLFSTFTAGCGLSATDVDAVQYLYGNSSGPCTDTELTVYADGEVSLITGLANGLGSEGECADPVTLDTTIPEGEALALIEAVTENYNADYEPAESGCEGAWATITLIDTAGDDLAVTDNLECAGSMSAARQELAELEADLGG